MISSARACRLAALTGVALALSLGRAPASAEDAKDKVETPDFDLSIPTGWTGKAIPEVAHVFSSAAILECAAARVRIVVNVNYPLKTAAEMAEARKDMQEKPGMGAAAYVMPMALKVAQPAIMVFDELVLAGEPTAAARVIAAPNNEDFASFHGSVRVVGDRILCAAVVTKGKQGAPEPDPAHLKAIEQGYKTIRDLRLKKR